MTSFQKVGTDFEEYLRDESRRAGYAETISFPRSEEEVKSHLEGCRNEGITVTIQGARTGITGGAVPQGGHILNLSRMNRIDLADRKAVLQPGVLLADLNSRCGDYFFPPDPTETTASLGGMVACNASGARTFRYGSTREYVERLRIVLLDGNTLELKRGEHQADKGRFSLPAASGTTYSGQLPGYTMPEGKNAAGLFVQPDMDLIDLFIGSEGTLGVITEIECKLLEKPGALWGVVAFFSDEDSAVAFVKSVRSEEAGKPGAIEYFDADALDLLRSQKQSNPAFAEIPDMPAEYRTAVYVEYHAEDNDAASEMVFTMADLMADCGSSEDATWIASGEKELVRLKDFRHAIPEAVNLVIDGRRKIDPEVMKLGTDMAVPDEHLSEVLSLYRTGLMESGLESVIFGHIGNNHLHVNILPHTRNEFEKGKELYLSWAEEVVGMKGTVSAEHGIGKAKREFLEIMYGKSGIEEMERVIRMFNPQRLLSPHTMTSQGD